MDDVCSVLDVNAASVLSNVINDDVDLSCSSLMLMESDGSSPPTNGMGVSLSCVSDDDRSYDVGVMLPDPACEASLSLPSSLASLLLSLSLS